MNRTAASLLLAVTALTTPSLLQASDAPLGELVAYQQDVVHIPAGSLRQNAVDALGVTFTEQDRVRTLAGSSATVALADGSSVQLLERSLLRFDGAAALDTEEGRVLFEIQEQGTGSGMTVSSRTVVIGVKGTRFIVDADEEGMALYMDEGLVEMTTTSGAFLRYKEEVLAQFEEFRREQLAAYAQFLKDRGIDPYERIERLEVGAGQAVRVVDDLLMEIETPPDIVELFERLSAQHAGS